jgi:hypothetical protein
MASADAAVYAAKHGGRNQVVGSGALAMTAVAAAAA